MPSRSNMTCTPRGVPTQFLTKESKAPTSIPEKVVTSKTSTEHLRTVPLKASNATNSDIPPPVFDCSPFSFKPEFKNQADLDQRWTALKNYLTSAILPEQEILEVLRSGILQADAGKTVKGLFAEAMLRSIRAQGALTEPELKRIVGVLCDLPPSQWQAQFGENVRFSNEQGANGVMGFIQSGLDISSAERDRKIADEQLVSDAQWDAIKGIAPEIKKNTRTDHSRLDSAYQMLKDDLEPRPSPKDVQKNLAEVIAALRAPPSGVRVRWSEEFINRVEAVHDQFMPGYQGASPAPAEAAPDVLISLKFNKPLQSNTGAKANKDQPDSKPLALKNPPPALLEELQAFERHGNFYLNVTDSGPRIPESLAGKMLWALNTMDTFNVLRLDSSHISTTRPAPEPSNHAWKNGESDFSATPFEPATEQPQASPDADALAKLKQFVAQADEVLDQIASKFMPWGGAHAQELEEVKVLLNPLREEIYRATTEAVSTDSSNSLGSYVPNMNGVGEQLRSWLERIGASMASGGVAVLSRTGEFVERNPGKTVAAFAAYAAVGTLYANCFLPEAEEMVDPLQGLMPDLNDIDDEETVIHEYVLDGINELFEEFPVLAEAVKQRLAQYLDGADDTQLIADFEVLLAQSVPGHENVTYKDYLDEIIELAILDAQDGFEDDSDDESTTETVNLAHAEPVMATVPAHAIKKRSADDDFGMPFSVETSESGVAAHASAYWLIEAGRSSSDAEIILQPGEEIAPGVTIEQGADMFIEAFLELQNVLDPSLFVHTIVNTTISESDLPERIKTELNMDTEFNVQFSKPRGDHLDFLPSNRIRYKSFTLTELFCGQHDKAKQWGEKVSIFWPDGYTAAFKAEVTKNDLQDRFAEQTSTLFARPEIAKLWMATKKYELNEVIKVYLKEGDESEGKSIARDFLEGNIKAQTISIRNKALGSLIAVTNAVYLSRGEGSSPEGVFVFLGGNGTVIEKPSDLLTSGGRSIEKFPQLRDELSKRINLKDLLARNDEDFKYSNGRIKYGDGIWTLVGFSLKFPYQPIIFGMASGDDFSVFEKSDDLFEDLYKRQVAKVESDINVMISTPKERDTDVLLGLLSDALTMFALMAGGPKAGAGLRGLAMLFGATSSAVDYTRGMLNDDPQHSEQHKANGLYGLIFQVAAPFVGSLLGSVFSSAVNSRLSATIIERMKISGNLPKGVIKYLPKYSKVPRGIVNPARQARSAKYIPPKVKDPSLIQYKFENAFKNKLVSDRLKSLGIGPKVAQKLMKNASVTYFSGPKDGYVYRGFVMRGDVRLPQDVFKNGFKLPAASTDPKKLSGMNGVMPSDNAGISTSPLYSQNGLGAYNQGGKKGGYTYLVDARTIDGYDVLRNNHWVNNPGSRIGTKPTLINYGESIPPERILGAYTGEGKFIPNPAAIRQSISESIPTLVGPVPAPLKPLVKNKTFTSATKLPFPEPL